MLRRVWTTDMEPARVKRSLVIAAVLLQVLLVGAEGLDYGGWKSKAEQLMAEHKSERLRGLTTPWSQKDKAALAGEAWLAAAQQCQDVSLRFQALEQAVLAFGESRSSVDKERTRALTEARDLVGAPEADRARMALKLAYSTRQRKDFEAVTAFVKASPQVRGEAYHELAVSYLQDAKKDAKLNQPMAEAYEKAAAAYAEADLGRAGVELGQALLAAEKIPDASVAVALLDRLSKAHLGYRNYQTELGQAMVRLRWADGLEKVGAVDRAQALRRELGKRPQAPADQREQAWLKASEAELQRKQPARALGDLDEAARLRADNFVYSEKIAHKRIEVLYAQKDLEGIARSWGQLAAHPKASPVKRDECRMQQVRWLRELKREAEADTVLDQIIAGPASNETLLKACEARVKGRLDRKEFAPALEELSRFEARFPTPPKGLMDLRGRCLALQGKEAEALDYWEKIHRDPGGRVVPSATMVSGAEELLRGHLAAGRLEQADALRVRARGWSVQPMMHELWDAEVAVARGDKAAAGQALERARAQLNRFSGDSRTRLEKRIAELARKL